jgi:hypothetical protein
MKNSMENFIAAISTNANIAAVVLLLKYHTFYILSMHAYERIIHASSKIYRLPESLLTESLIYVCGPSGKLPSITDKIAQ